MSNDLTKDEVSAVAQKAGCAWLHEPLAQRFAALCRAPLVAENAALKQAHEINADTLNAMQVEIDDWKARALKAEQAGEPVAGDGARLAQELWLSVIHNIAYQNNGNSVLTGTTAMRELKAMIDHVCIGIDSPPKPAAQEPAAWRKKSANGEWVLYYQNVGWKDLSGFEPLYPVQKSAAKVVQLTEDQTEELIEDLCNTYGLSGDLEEVVSIVVEFINKAAK